LKPSFHRLHGCKLAEAIVPHQTLSSLVRDPLCGSRCIPRHDSRRVLDGVRAGARMDFDPGLVIRPARAGPPVVDVPTAVRRPKLGVSHLRTVEDELLVAWRHVRLVLEAKPGPFGRRVPEREPC